MRKNNQIWFSVIIPLHNKEPHIADTLSSVLAQTYPYFEVIVVNDASTDKSREIVEQFSDQRIRILDRKVPGPGGYAARNYGIREAEYDWIAFLDADDTWNTYFLEEMELVIENNSKCGFFASGWYESSSSLGKIPNSYTQRFSSRGPHKLNFILFMKRAINKLPPACSSAVIVKKNLIIEAGLFPEKKCLFGGDTDTWFRIMDVGNELVINPIPLATYNKDAVNMVTKTNQLNIIETCVRKTAIQLLKENEVKNITLMKKFVNHYQFLQIRKKCMAAQLETADLQFLFKSTDPLKYYLFYFFSLLSFDLQQSIVRIYSFLK